MIIGIDLGTTNSAAAYLSDDGPRLIPNALGDILTPSVIGFPVGSKLLVGRPAAEYLLTGPERCATLFKRRLGTDWRFEVDGRYFTAEQLVAFLLESIKHDAEAHLRRPIERAVITVPAYFNEHQRRGMIRAGQMAGLSVEGLLNEPTAAALAYGMHQSSDGRTAAVLDLGGGTLDVSIVQMHDSRVEVLASSGESFLGGENFTRAMAARILEAQNLVFERAELEHPRMVARLIQQCEKAKRQLSTQESAIVRLPNKRGEISEERPGMVIKRRQFEAWTSTIMERVESPIRRSLSDADLKKREIHDVILVGGASRMPQFRERARELFGKPCHTRLNPDEAVALGASIYAGHLHEAASGGLLQVRDVAPHSMGISISKKFGGQVKEGYYLPIIHRNTPLPVTRVERVSTLYANQTEVKVRLYQGESRQVAENLFLGEFIVKGIPKGPAGQEVEIRLTYDQNGVLEVEAEVLSTRTRTTLVITRDAAGLSEVELNRALANMERLKRHPREDLPNETIMRRAERMYRELTMLDREVLADLLDRFEEVMETRSKEQIEAARLELEEFMDRCESKWDGVSGEDEEEGGWGI